MKIPETVQSQFLIGLTREQLENVPWGVAKVNRDGVFTYANRALCQILGVGSLEGKSVADVFSGEDLTKVREHLDSRFSHRAADEYDVEAIRPADGLRVRVRCSAMPDIDDRGEIVGAVAIVRDLLAEDVSTKVLRAMEDLRDSKTILEALARQCERIVPFDVFGVTLFSEDGEHSRIFYLYPEHQFRPTLRWREATSFAKLLMSAKQVINLPDLVKWLEQPEWQKYREDTDTQQLLAMGLRSSLSFPVIKGNQVVARIGFGRKQGRASFSKEDEEHIASLPLAAAVRMALHYEEIEQLKFALKLVEQIASRPENTDFIAARLVKEIADHYKWENVSIFRPDKQAGELCLVKQETLNKSFLLDEKWRHPIDKGVTGLVCRTMSTINVPDVTAPEFRSLYLAAYAESRSELCIPIVVHGRVYWVLNIEDSKRNAFAKEEQAALENILQYVAVVLELVSQTQIFTELLRKTKDGVIQTDLEGTITETNPATEVLLGYSKDEMKRTTLSKYFEDKDQARRVQEAEYVPNDEVHLVHKDGTEVSVLLSGTSLPREIGLKVYICNDLSARKRMETVEILRLMFNEIASQIKTPLSLAFTWLDKLRELEPQPPAADLIDKATQQLHKVDLTFERLLFYERNKSIVPTERSLFEIPVLIDKIKEELPKVDADHIEVTVAPDVRPVHGNIFQIWFCLESALAYLIRFVPESERVAVDIRPQRSQVVVAIQGFAPRITGGAIADYAETQWAIRAITEMAFGEEIIRNFIERDHAGKFDKLREDDNRVKYVIALPGA